MMAVIKIGFSAGFLTVVYVNRDPDCLCLDNIEGFILNVPHEYKFGFVLLPVKRRHWIALKKINGAFYNLDSKLDSPQLIGKVNTDISFVFFLFFFVSSYLFYLIT